MNLVCPKCLEESDVRVSIADGDSCTCPGCEEEFAVAAVVKLVESWAAALPWLLAHPARTQQPATV